MGDHLCIAIDERMTQLSERLPDCYIFRVHDRLRSINKKAYEPDMISIGPYHKDNLKLQMMEEHKLRYFKLLLQRQGKSIRYYVTIMESLEKEARECYAEPISLDSHKFIEMMILDGCFIIELVRKFKDATLREKNDPLFRHDWIVNNLQRDLMLFENQLPFFVLLELYDMIVGEDIQKFYGLLSKFFSDLFPIPGYCADPENNMPDFDMNHLLEVVYYTWLPKPILPNPPEPDLSEPAFRRLAEPGLHESPIVIELSVPSLPETSELFKSKLPEEMEDRKPIRSAIELVEANIKFRKINNSNILDIEFNNGLFSIPTLKMEDRTESFFRNLIAYEQYSQEGLSLVTNYVTLMDSLIDSPKDIDVLCRSGIIINQLGDDEVAADVFNKIARFVTEPSGFFHNKEIFDKVNSHCDKRQNRWIANLRHNYMNSPWALISVLAALVLLILTFTQTFMSIFPR